MVKEVEEAEGRCREEVLGRRGRVENEERRSECLRGGLDTEGSFGGGDDKRNKECGEKGGKTMKRRRKKRGETEHEGDER